MTSAAPTADPQRQPVLGSDGRIVEGLVTTLEPAGGVHVAPMGPIVARDFSRLVLRPFQSSTTFANLRSRGGGVFHVTDDVELIARAAVERPLAAPAWFPAASIQGAVLRDACRWYAFVVESIDDREPRAAMTARVVDQGVLREFVGFNRAKHAVVEAAILATRLHLLPAEQVRCELDRLAPLVEKTGAAEELQAFAYLRQAIEQASR